MYFVHPKEGERLCLRLLLLHVKGPTSFEHLRTVGNIIYDTFREAAYALGLLGDDSEWLDCLEEAAFVSRPKELRHLFATILCNCCPADPLQLWNRFADELSEDMLHWAQTRNLFDSQEEQIIQSRQSALFAINQVLDSLGFGLHNFPTLPQEVSESIISF